MSRRGHLYRKVEGLSELNVADGYIIYDAHRGPTHFLNPTAAAVLELCDGANDAGAIAAVLQSAFNLPEAPIADVEGSLASLHSNGLIAPCRGWRHLWSFFASKAWDNGRSEALNYQRTDMR